MRILHTSDWHVGKVLKGQSRVDDHIAALAQVVDVARAERPDLVVVAGDLYDTASPTPEATRIVTRALSALRATGADESLMMLEEAPGEVMRDVEEEQRDVRSTSPDANPH